MTFLLAVTLAAGFYAYEKSLPYQLADYLSWLLAVFVVGAWVWVSFVSGFMKRGYFLALSLFYWTVPQFVIMGYTHFSQVDYNSVFHISSRVSEVLVRAPVANIAETLGIGGFIAGMALLVLSEMVFFIGVVYRGMCKDFRWYCDFRERFEV